MTRVAEAMARLGFKPVTEPGDEAAPGVLAGLAYDASGDRLVRVGARAELLLGHDLTRNYRLPIERQCLRSAVPEGPFRAPAPEYELILLVLGVLLRQSTLEILSRRGRGAWHERLSQLQGRASLDRVRTVLREDLPFLEAEAFAACLEALRPEASGLRRVRARLQLQRRLKAYARRPPAIEVGLRLWRKGALLGRRWLLGSSVRRRLRTGGAVIAVVGGDGAGKSTLVEGLTRWLSTDFATANVHLGKPRWSSTTASVRAVLKLGQLLGLYPPEATFRETLARASRMSIGYPFLLREVCRARDRHALYVGARRFAARGGLVISDRFPLPQIRLMDGPQGRRFLERLWERPQGWLAPRPGDRLAGALVRLEEGYYRRLTPPELVIVLRVDPEIAVARRSDEDAAPVRERSTEIWRLDWEPACAFTLDAGRSREEVLAEAKALVWSAL
jgi:thymidylate kinase